MLHPFIPSQINANKCASCKYEAIDHTDRATCEACGNTGTCEISGPLNHPQSMLLCMDCQDAEKKAVAAYQSPEAQDARARAHNEKNNKHIIEQAKETDQAIKVRTDIFNAQTIASIDIFKAIDSDQTIQNKLAAKHEFTKERINHLKKVIFGARETLEQANSELYAVQAHWNEFSNTLRSEIREQYRISNVNYQPITPKTVKAKQVKAKVVKKFDKHTVREAAAKYNVPIDAVQMICVARNLDAESAAIILAKQIHG